jgi:hypothetical protein
MSTMLVGRQAREETMASQIGSARGARLVERIERYDFELIAPHVRQTGARRDIHEIQQFRSRVFREFDSLPASDALTDPVDDDAWHIVARLDAVLVGCIRIRMFADAAVSDVPERVLRTSGCTLSSADYERCVRAIRQFVAARRPTSSPVLQFGGLAVAPIARRSAVAAGLCLAGTAFSRCVGSVGGVLLAAEKSRTESLYAKAGAFRLTADGELVAPLVDTSHRDRVLVMGMVPFGNAADVEVVVELFNAMLFSHRMVMEACCA